MIAGTGTNHSSGPDIYPKANLNNQLSSVVSPQFDNTKSMLKDTFNQTMGVISNSLLLQDEGLAGNMQLKNSLQYDVGCPTMV